MIKFVMEWAIRSSILIGCGALLLGASRIRDASLRLAAWTALLTGSMAIPFVGAVLPTVPMVWAREAARPVYVETPVRAAAPGAEVPENGGVQPAQDGPKVFDYRSAAALVYAAIAGVLLLRVCIGLALSFRLRGASRATDLDGVRESESVVSPVTIGVVRPVTVLPMDWREWDATKLTAVLAHERSHVERWDPAVQLLSAIHRALLWISPLSWMLDRWIVRAAEEASDDAAVAATEDRPAYAEVLLQFVTKKVEPVGIGMARYGGVEKRIDRVLDGTGFSRGVARWSAAAIVALACPLAYLAAAASPQKERGMQFPALPLPVPAAPPAPVPAPVQIAQAQTPPPRPATPEPLPEFDAVSIKPLGPVGEGGGRGGTPSGPSVCRPLRYTAGMVSGAATALRLIQDGYGLSPHQISGGPDWVRDERFCIEAKSAGPAEQDQLKIMLRTMLADRFKLVVRHETKEMPVYVMTVAKKGLLRELKPGEPTTGGITVQDLAGYEFRTQVDQSVAPKVLVDRNTTQGFAAILSDFSLELDRPVVDKTGLQGNYMFVMRWTDDDFRGDLERQFGLRLEAQKAPLPTVVIESMEKPSPN